MTADPDSAEHQRPYGSSNSEAKQHVKNQHAQQNEWHNKSAIQWVRDKVNEWRITIITIILHRSSTGVSNSNKEW